jgi:[CysO sulfur-carrier protein]-S-L-cysteine hydrolase
MNQSSVLLKVSQLLTLEHAANLSNPYESCALLLGKKNGNVYEVYEVIPVTNKYTSEVSFGMDENELLKIYKYAESSNISVVGIFHSHPSNPVPSETDKVFMEINPVPWIIKSTITDDIKCFVFSDVLKGKIDGIEEIQMIVVKD